MRTHLLVALSVLTLTATGSTAQPVPAVLPAASSCRRFAFSAPPPVAVVVLVDASGSRTAVPMEAVTADVARLVELLPPGSEVQVRWIIDSADDSRAAALSERLLRVEPRPTPPKNRFDMNAKQRFQAALAAYTTSRDCFRNGRHEVAERVRMLRPSAPAKKTDIYSAATRAGDILAMFPSTTVRFAVLLSDGEDNVNKVPTQAVAGLAGALALVRTHRAGAAAEHTARTEHDLTARFQKLGFDPVTFVPDVVDWRTGLAKAGIVVADDPTDEEDPR